MKIQDDSQSMLDTPAEFGEEFFSIQTDRSLLFDVLRSKMYSNAILAICREITCNARDAHREVGKTDIPIQIYIPNDAEPYFKVKDWGPGLGPDRIKIFTEYMASTKRDDNTQTGGFGLGAKTPFAYSDSFSVVTVYNGTKYNYTCFIDPTKKGKIVPLSVDQTNEPNSTEIIVPVKRTDFRYFYEFTEQSTRHWNVKPIIKGAQMSWKNLELSTQGDGWALCKNQYTWNIKAIVDGIEYPVNKKQLKKFVNIDYSNNLRGDLYLYFNTGEISLSANREQIYLDKITQNKLAQKIEFAYKQITHNFTTRLEQSENLWDANCWFTENVLNIFNSYYTLTNNNIAASIKWKDIPVHYHYAKLDVLVVTFSKENKSTTDSGTETRIRTHRSDNLSFEKNSMLIFNDLPILQPNVNHIKKIFDDNPKLKSIQVICPQTKGIANVLDDLNQDIHLDQMKPKMLSSYVTTKKKVLSSAHNRLIVYKLDLSSKSFQIDSYAAFEADTKTKVLCQLYKHPTEIPNKHISLGNKGTINPVVFSALAAQYPNYSFYGVDENLPKSRINEEFENFIKIEDFLNDQLLNRDVSEIQKIKYAFECFNAYIIDKEILSYYDECESKILNKSSLFLERLRSHKELAQSESQIGIVTLYEYLAGVLKKENLNQWIIDNPRFNLQFIDDWYYDQYPLLRYIGNANYKEAILEIIQYVNLIDRDLK